MKNYDALFESSEAVFDDSDSWVVEDPPHGWHVERTGVWKHYLRPSPIPPFGWKVHISATLADAPDVAKIVADTAFRHDCSFKYLWGKTPYLSLHSKNASRFQSGKFVALYPHNELTAEQIMESLNSSLSSYKGMDVLTDRSYKGASNIFYRWGAFKNTGRINSKGEPEDLIPNGNGELVPDVRTAVFLLPDGVLDPFSEMSAPSEPGAPPDSITFDRFKIESVMRFTNAGGRYKAVCELSGNDVFIKEGRPNTGFVGEDDGVQRLHKEVDILREVNRNCGGLAPKLLKVFSVHSHHFAAIEYIDGTLLTEWIAQENPFYSHAHRSSSLTEKYFSRATKILNKLREDVDALHSAGWAFGDLSPSNIIIDENDNPFLIDFEACVPADSLSATVGTPDFCLIEQAGELSAQNRDIYAFHCIAVSLVLRLTTLAELSGHVLTRLTDEVHAIDKNLPDWWHEACHYVDRVAKDCSKYRRDGLDRLSLEGSAQSNHLIDDLAGAVAENLSLNKRYLFPASNKGVKGAFLSFSCGDTGVLSALNKYHQEPQSEELLARYVASVEYALDQETLPLGYEYGLAGIFDTYSQLGLTHLRTRMHEHIFAGCKDIEDPSLATGLAGIALALFENGFVADAKEIIEKAILNGISYPWSKNGLFYGRAGLISAACRLGTLLTEHSDLTCLVDQLIREEMAQTVRHPSGGSLSLRGETDGNRLLPYLRDGTAGLLLALLLASESKSIDYCINDTDLVALAADLGTPLMLEGSLMDGVSGIAVVLDLLKAHRPDLADNIPDANWSRLIKYLLPCGTGIGVINPRSYKYDFSHAQGSSGILEALLWRNGTASVNLSGLHINPIS